MRTFREAYIDLLNSARAIQQEFDSVAYVRNVDPESWARKRTAVAAAAEVAAVPYSRHGGMFTLRNAAYITQDFDPLTNWERSLSDPEQMAPETVIAAVDSAMARALQEASEAKQRERGLTGLVAGFLRWRSDLQDAVGAGHPSQRKAAGLIGGFAQGVVAALATSAAAGIVTGLVKLWGWIF